MGHVLVVVALSPTAVEDLGCAADEALEGLAAEQPRWSRWLIGGRFAGHFSLRPGADRSGEILRGSQGPLDRADGGVLQHLDLAAMRRGAADRARAAHGRWREIDAAAPGTLPMSHFHTLHLAAPASFPLHVARQAHAAQPQVATARAEGLIGRHIDPVAALADEQHAVTTAADRAITGNGLAAFLDLDGCWSADPANIGDLPPSADSDRFHRETNDYIAALDPRCALVAVDLTT
ncbi:hypothetical protein ACFRMQ_00100 [Kitasatospora sp. NPDC056783]|uniref:hypothetical protein n=1 Tax=Kitasatospora sp. NPDC056783 TaxID=3345943 RepID=UPI003677EC1F